LILYFLRTHRIFFFDLTVLCSFSLRGYALNVAQAFRFYDEHRATPFYPDFCKRRLLMHLPRVSGLSSWKPVYRR